MTAFLARRPRLRRGLTASLLFAMFLVPGYQLVVKEVASAQSPGALGGASFPTTVNAADYVEIISAAGGAAHQMVPVGILDSVMGGVNAQTGTAYTVLPADMGKLITFNNGGAVAVTLPSAAVIGASKQVAMTDLGVGTATITPAAGTICGAATLAIGTNRGAILVSDGTNWNCEGGTSHLSQTPASAAEGGTGRATLTAHALVVGEGTAAVGLPSVGTTGQLLQGVTGGDPAFATALSGAYNFTNPLVTYGNAAGAPTHIATQQQTAPALTSCGTSPSIAGTDEAGIVTMGTGSPTGCVITFNVAYTGTPFCVVSWIATPLASQSYATSNSAITLTQTATSSNKVQYICRAPAGG